MSYDNSSEVKSGQTEPHRHLARHLQRHLASAWQKPAQAVDLPALRQLDELLAEQRPIVLDSFCGNGQSTAILADRYPDALVVGVDKSAYRLQRHEGAGSGYVLLQAHCEAVWRYLVEREVTLLAHYLLYPNPWPKARHLSRRIHGHPAFPLLIELSGIIELRSNWQVYVEEFGVALHLAGYPSRIAVIDGTLAPMTPFEQKYRGSGHRLWRLDARLNPPNAGLSAATYSLRPQQGV